MTFAISNILHLETLSAIWILVHNDILHYDHMSDNFCPLFFCYITIWVPGIDIAACMWLIWDLGQNSLHLTQPALLIQLWLPRLLLSLPHATPLLLASKARHGETGRKIPWIHSVSDRLYCVSEFRFACYLVDICKVHIFSQRVISDIWKVYSIELNSTNYVFTQGLN